MFAEAQAGAVNKFGNDFFEVFKTVDFGFKTAGTENAFLNFGIFKFNAGNAVQLLQSLFGQNTKTLANQRARRGSQFGSGKNAHEIELFDQFTADAPDIADVKLLKRGGDISRFGQNADFAGSLLFGDFAGNFAEGFGGCGADRNRNAGLFHDGIANHQGYVLQVFPVVNFGKSFVNRINFNFAEVAFNQPHNAFGHVGVEFVVGRQRYAAGCFEHFFDFEIGCAHRDTECLGFI